MPRNGSSVYSLPAGNPVISGTVIATTWANTTLTDIATALTNSLSTDGSTASVSLAGKTMAGGTFANPIVSTALDLTGGQINFPAVQIPSGGANVLDDYEEGTWTPSLSFTTPGNINVVYSSRAGTYTKIGRSVSVTGGLSTSTFTHTTASGDAVVSGLPFASIASTTANSGSGPLNFNGLTVGGTVVQVNVFQDSTLTRLRMYAAISGGTSGFLTTTNFPTGAQQSLYFSLTYDT